MTSVTHVDAITSETGLTIRDALVRISQGAVGALVLLDDEGRLRGLVTDGDIRRALLQGIYIEEPLARILNTNPLSVLPSATLDQRRRILNERRLRHLLIIDEERRFVDLVLADTVELNGAARCPVIIMAGGRGKRLGPLTDECPKPMLRIGGVPILERIVRRFIELGFVEFYFSVNYKKKQIIEHFGNGRKFKCQVNYLQEDEPRGTASSLALLPDLQARNYLVTNGDVLTDVDYALFQRYHEDQGAAATMAVRKVQHTLSFGMVKVDGTELLSIEEKPTLSFYVNAGIYMLSRDTLKLVPRERFFDMPDLFQMLRSSNQPCSIYEVHGDWIDIGTPEMLREANARLSR